MVYIVYTPTAEATNQDGQDTTALAELSGRHTWIQCMQGRTLEQWDRGHDMLYSLASANTEQNMSEELPTLYRMPDPAHRYVAAQVKLARPVTAGAMHLLSELQRSI